MQKGEKKQRKKKRKKKKATAELLLGKRWDLDSISGRGRMCGSGARDEREKNGARKKNDS